MKASDSPDDATQNDAALVELAKSGDPAAFAELYERYFDRVYDFLARMVHDSSEAADLTQDAFLKAMNSLNTLTKGASFKSWLFTIARNTALNRLERASRTQPLEVTNDAGEEQRYDVIDEDRFGNPEEAAEASSLASVVWEAAAALDPKYRSVLLLNLREGLDSAEIADVMGVTKNHAYVLVNRMKAALESAVGAVALFRSGRSQCAELDAVISRLQVAELSPEARRVIERHAGACPNCQEQRSKLSSPFAIVAGMAFVQPAPGVKEGILGGLEAAFSALSSSGGGAAAGGGGPEGATGQTSSGPGAGNDGTGTQASHSSNGGGSAVGPASNGTSNGFGPSTQDGGSEGAPPGMVTVNSDDGHGGRRRSLVLAAVAALLLLVGGPVATLAFFGDDGEGKTEQAAVQEPATTSPTPVPTNTPSPTPTATATPTVAVQVVPPTDTPSPQPSTPVPIEPGPGGPSIAPGGGSGDAPPTAQPPTAVPGQQAGAQPEEEAPPGITPEPSNAPPAGDDGDVAPSGPNAGNEPDVDTGPDEGSPPDDGSEPDEEVEPDPGRESEPPAIVADPCTPSLSVSPTSLLFSEGNSRQTIVLQAVGCGDVLRFTAQPGARWIFAIPPSGSIPDGGSASVIIEVDLEEGAGESGRMRIESVAGAIDIPIKVEARKSDPLQRGDDLQQPCGVNCPRTEDPPPSFRSN